MDSNEEQLPSEETKNLKQVSVQLLWFHLACFAKYCRIELFYNFIEFSKFLL